MSHRNLCLALCLSWPALARPAEDTPIPPLSRLDAARAKAAKLREQAGALQKEIEAADADVQKELEAARAAAEAAVAMLEERLATARAALLLFPPKKVPPVKPDPTIPIIPDRLLPEKAPADKGLVRITLPETAVLKIDGEHIPGSGAKRTWLTRTLPDDTRTYYFDVSVITAKATKTKRVFIRAGQALDLDMTGE